MKMDQLICSSFLGKIEEMDNTYQLKHDLDKNWWKVLEFFVLPLTWPPTNGLLMDFLIGKYKYFTYK